MVTVYYNKGYKGKSAEGKGTWAGGGVWRNPGTASKSSLQVKLQEV